MLVDRANYGRLRPVMQAIREHPRLELLVLCAGTMVLERFDQPVHVVRDDGFTVDGEIYVELEGSKPVTMAKSVGFATTEFASEFHRLSPDVIVLIGDRYEALAAAIAAAYMNLPILHLQGGEVSGSIDESARHAITKFAQFHFPSTQRSAQYLLRMGERPETILGVGCPSGDIALNLDRRLSPELLNGRGAGATIDPDRSFLLVVFHPTTTEYGGERAQMEQLLLALDDLDLPTVLLWPNIDAGADHISKAIRTARTHGRLRRVRTLTNLSPDAYLVVLANTACAVGNSSSFVRDASFLGTPVVLVGERQEGRESAAHVTKVDPSRAAIVEAVRRQVAHGPYEVSRLYGRGDAGRAVAQALAEATLYVQKRLHFVHERPEEPKLG